MNFQIQRRSALMDRAKGNVIRVRNAQFGSSTYAIALEPCDANLRLVGTGGGEARVVQRRMQPGLPWRPQAAVARLLYSALCEIEKKRERERAKMRRGAVTTPRPPGRCLAGCRGISPPGAQLTDDSH